jgi:transcription elongation factor Elf1
MEEKFFICPYCNQRVSTLLDMGVDDTIELVDDCEVCCRPIEIIYRVDDYQLISFQYFAIDGNEF